MVKLPFNRFVFLSDHPRFYCGLASKINDNQGLLQKKFTPLIGLEIHAQLILNTKLFTRVPYKFGCSPNTLIGLNDLAVPGSMPVGSVE